MFQQELIDKNLLVDKFIENYKITSFISSGSFGAVYLASKNDKD